MTGVRRAGVREKLRLGTGGRPVPSSPPWAARRVRRAWAELTAPTLQPSPFRPETLSDLPEPARRYLTHVIAPGTPLWQSVEVSMAGQIRIKGWWPCTATQVVAPRGYVWAADTRLHRLPVLGYDRLSGGTAEMRWRLLDLIPVVSATGPDIVRSAAGRLASEIALLPTSYANGAWLDSGSPDTAVVSWGVGAEQQLVTLHLGPDGRLLDLVMQRWGSPDGKPFGRYPFGATFAGERTDSGVTLPAAVLAGWWWGTDRQGEGEFFRMSITGACFR